MGVDATIGPVPDLRSLLMAILIFSMFSLSFLDDERRIRRFSLDDFLESDWDPVWDRVEPLGPDLESEGFSSKRVLGEKTIVD